MARKKKTAGVKATLKTPEVVMLRLPSSESIALRLTFDCGDPYYMSIDELPQWIEALSQFVKG